MRVCSNLIVVSLSLADLLMLLKVPIFLFNAYHGGPHLGIIGAKVKFSSVCTCLLHSFHQVYGVVSIISGMASIWSLTFLTLERAKVIKTISRRAHHNPSKIRMKVAMTLIWGSAVVLSLAPLFGWNRFVYEV